MGCALISSCIHFHCCQQFMRTPAQAKMNVVMREDLDTMRDEAKYLGMADQAKHLQKRIQQECDRILTYAYDESTI